MTSTLPPNATADWLEPKNAATAVKHIKDQEQAYVFTSFDASTAFNIGWSIKRSIAQGESALVSVRLYSGLTIFQAAVGEGVQLDNEQWVQRKFNTVRKYGKSTFLLGRELAAKGRDINSIGADLAAHGGGFPIRIKGCPFPIGAIIVSGLPQWRDHAIVVDAIKPYTTAQDLIPAQ